MGIYPCAAVDYILVPVGGLKSLCFVLGQLSLIFIGHWSLGFVVELFTPMALSKCRALTFETNTFTESNVHKQVMIYEDIFTPTDIRTTFITMIFIQSAIYSVSSQVLRTIISDLNRRALRDKRKMAEPCAALFTPPQTGH